MVFPKKLKKIFLYDIILTIKFSIRKERFMYKINELSSIFDVSTNTIRRYEDYGYISPSRDDENNYRYYSEEDIDKLVYISKSRGFGFSHTDISDMTKASIYDLVDIYEKRNLEFDEEIKLLQEKKNRLKNDLKLLINCRDNVGRFIVYPNVDYTFMVYKKDGKTFMDKEHVSLLKKFIQYQPFVQQIYYYDETCPDSIFIGLGIKTIYIKDESIFSNTYTKRFLRNKKSLFYYGKCPYDANYFIDEKKTLKETRLYKTIFDYMQKYNYKQNGEIYMFTTASSIEDGNLYRYFITVVPIE